MSKVIKSLIVSALITMGNPVWADKLHLNEISNYLNSLKTAAGEFTQVNDDGSVSTGKLFLKRPGRIRFEYADAVVVAQNGAVKIVDKKSNSGAQTYPLKRTPLSIILARNVNLARENMVVGQDYDGVATIVKAQDPQHPEYGSIELKFTANPTQLRQWVLHNAEGGTSTVILGALDTKKRIPNRVFDLKEVVK